VFPSLLFSGITSAPAILSEGRAVCYSGVRDGRVENPVRMRMMCLPDGDWFETAPSLEEAIERAYHWNAEDTKAAEVEVAPGVWYMPNPCLGSYVN
jgi:hypothetical protein